MNDLKKNYTAMVQWSEEDTFYLARIRELDGCIAHGFTEAEALKNVREMEKLALAALNEAGQETPEPIELSPDLSGKWLQRVPRKLHGLLRAAAEKDGVSLNLWCATVLAKEVSGSIRCPDCGFYPGERTADGKAKKASEAIK